MSEESYVDEVPFCLNQHFYPRPAFRHRNLDLHIPLEALQDEYDFSKEKKVLEEIEAWRETLRQEERKREEEKQAAENSREAKASESHANEDSKEELESADSENVEKPKEDAEQPSSTWNQAPEEPSQLNSFSSGNPAAVINQTPTYLPSYNYGYQYQNVYCRNHPYQYQYPGMATVQPQQQQQLQPQPIPPVSMIPTMPTITPAQTNNQPNSAKLNQNSSTAKDQSSNIKHTLNYSDFEADSTDPFENVELKSINDMEVLANVLKNHSLSKPSRATAEAGFNNVTIPNTSSVSSDTAASILPSMSYEPNQSIYSPAIGMNTYPQTQGWNNANCFGKPSNPPLMPSVPPTTSSQSSPSMAQTGISAMPEPSGAENFNKFYFPLLTSMADSRNARERDRQLLSYDSYGKYSGNAPASTVTSSHNFEMISSQTPPSTSSYTPYPSNYINNSLSPVPFSNYYMPNNCMMKQESGSTAKSVMNSAPSYNQQHSVYSRNNQGKSHQ